MNASQKPLSADDSGTLLTNVASTAPTDRRRREAPPEWQQFSAAELADILDEAYAEEVTRRRETSFVPDAAERDAGTRFVTGLIVGLPLGMAIWGLVMGVLILLA